MPFDNIESELTRLGQNWPAPSIAGQVAQRLETLPRPRIQRSFPQRWRLTLIGSTISALVICAVAWTVLFGSSHELSAQVKDSIRRAKSAHIQITTITGKGDRLQGNLWYSREHGLRAESPDQYLVDDGRQQWTWNPASKPNDLVIIRRASRDAATMIAESLQLSGAPADWKQARATDLDRDIHGQKCEATLVQPPESAKSIAYGDSSPSRMRFIAWLDPQQRVVRVEDQREANKAWQTRREMQIDYDVEVAADKFEVHAGKDAKIVNGDGLWEERFPVEKALATVHSGGLLFAIHEVAPCENDMFFVVSSVRGTAAHLKQYPPQRRRLNLQTTILDVAEQQGGAGVLQNCHRAGLASTEHEGVHYLWWLAVPRKFFEMKDGKEVPLEGVGTQLEDESGHVRIPLSAYYRDTRLSGKQETAQADVQLPADAKPLTLQGVASLVLKDAMLNGEGIGLYGGIDNDTIRVLRPAEVTDASYADQIRSQLKWLHSFDKTSGAAISGPPPGAPQP